MVLLVPLRASVGVFGLKLLGGGASRSSLTHTFSIFRMSYGSGRPAILKDDESIWKCRLLLRHPLSIEDDMRLVSTVELMAIRERVNNSLAGSTTGPVDERTFEVLRTADAEFVNWYQTWDQAFSQKYEDAGMSFLAPSLSTFHCVLTMCDSLLPSKSSDSTLPCRVVS